MTRAAVFSMRCGLILLAGCNARETAEPSISTISFTGVAAEASVEPDAEVELLVTGTELWARPVTIEVHLTPQGQDDRIIEELHLQFDTTRDRQQAQGMWRVPREHLGHQGRHQLFFRAISEGQAIESSSIFIEAETRVEGVEWVNVFAGQEVRSGAMLTAEIGAVDAWRRDVEVTIFRRTENNEEVVLDTQTVTLDDGLETQQATVTWTVEGAFAERAGRSEILFRALLDGKQVETPVVIVDVVPAIVSLELFRENVRSRTVIQPGGILPVVDRLVVAISGTGLVGLESDVIFRRSNGAVFETLSGTITSNRFELSFDPSTLELGGEDGISALVRVVIGSLVAESGIRIDRAGFYGCDWYANGQKLSHGAEVRTGALVDLHADSWGLDGITGLFRVMEDDSTSDDDFIGTIDVIGGPEAVEIDWVTTYADDGTLAGDPEYYFIAEFGSLRCQSSQINVVR